MRIEGTFYRTDVAGIYSSTGCTGEHAAADRGPSPPALSLAVAEGVREEDDTYA